MDEVQFLRTLCLTLRNDQTLSNFFLEVSLHLYMCMCMVAAAQFVIIVYFIVRRAVIKVLLISL